METKNCPYCSEEIIKTAKKCKHCGEYLDDTLRNERKKDSHQVQPKEIIVKQKSSGLVTFMIVLVIIVLIGIITVLFYSSQFIIFFLFLIKFYNFIISVYYLQIHILMIYFFSQFHYQ